MTPLSIVDSLISDLPVWVLMLGSFALLIWIVVLAAKQIRDEWIPDMSDDDNEQET